MSKSSKVTLFLLSILFAIVIMMNYTEISKYVFRLFNPPINVLEYYD